MSPSNAVTVAIFHCAPEDAEQMHMQHQAELVTRILFHHGKTLTYSHLFDMSFSFFFRFFIPDIRTGWVILPGSD